MFAKYLRLPATVKLAKPHYHSSPDWRMKYVSNELTHNRYGFIVRKAVDKRAVVRNRIRRVFRSSVEELHSEMRQGYDMLFFLEKGIMDEQQQDIVEELRIVFRKKQLLA